MKEHQEEEEENDVVLCTRCINLEPSDIPDPFPTFLRVA